jgi:meso-butanediol dehydrogenase / (S,S)-butanediol dehydrogenase / diacetyl reductase
MYCMDLSSKVAIVTGGGKGIGRAIVEAFLDCGANVTVADLNINAVADLIKTFGEDRVFAIETNVTSKVDAENMITKTVEKFGRLDIIVNNAGISTMDFVTDIKEEDWDKVMNINAKGVFLCSQAAAKFMVQQAQGGKIINMASQAGKNGYRCMGNYCSSKHAVLGLTKVMAVELAKDQINVNAICPGIVETDMKRRERVLGGELRGMAADDIKNEDNSQVPLGRTAVPQDIANLVVFMASNYSDYMTGQAINITGGMTMN